MVATGSNGASGGWLIGLGAEYAFAQNWTAKLEYNYLDLGDTTIVTAIPPNAVTFAPSIHTVKLGVNYKFSWF